MVEPRPHGGDAPEGVLDFSASLNPLGPPERVLDLLEDGVDLTEYPYDARRSLRQSLADYWNVPSSEVLIGAGSSGLIQLLLGTLPGDRMLVPTPTFTEYEDLGRAAGWAIETIDFFHPDSDSDDFADVSLEGVDLLVLCNPNNPTGDVLSDRTVRLLLQKAERNNTLLVIDEAYQPFSADKNTYSTARQFRNVNNLIVLRSFSKFYGIPGLRVGYLLGPESTVDGLRSRQNPWPVGEPALRGAVECLRASSFRARTREFLEAERPRVREELESISNLRVVESSANYFLFKSPLPDLNDRLREHSLWLRDAATFTGLESGWYRVGLRESTENDRLLESLKAIHNRTRV